MSLSKDVFPTKTENNKNDKWSELLKSDEVLDIVVGIKKLGLPSNQGQRIALLQRLARRNPGDYRVSYDDLCDYSKEFEEAYPKSKIENTVRGMMKGLDFQSSLENIENDEIRWLFKFVFPEN